MTDHFPNPPDDDEHLVLVLNDMLERRTGDVQAKPDLARVRADAQRPPVAAGRPLDVQNESRRGPYLIAVAAALLVVIVGGASALGSRSNSIEGGPASDATDDDGSAPESSTGGPDTSAVDTTVPSTSTEPPFTGSTIVQSTTTTAMAESDGNPQVSMPPNQAEPGLLFDYGDIVRIERIGDVDWIWFDRTGFTEEQLQGTDLRSEPRYELATDWHGGVNTNPALRTYPLAPGAQVLQIDPETIEAACAGAPFPGTEFIESDVATMLAIDSRRVSLTFDDDYRVVLVRDQMGC